MPCITVTLGDLVLEDLAASDPDAVANVWSWTALDGWWENARPRMSRFPRRHHHGDHTFGRSYEPRAMTLAGFVNTGRDATRYYTALERIQTTADLVSSSGTLTVAEPIDPKFATVVLVDRPRVRRIGKYAGIEFEIPLLAPDPRKYGTTLHSATASGTHTNAGTAPSDPTMTVLGAATNPQWTLSGDLVKFTYSLAGGATLVVDFDDRTAIVDGSTDIKADLDVTTSPGWFTLAPGANVVAYSGGGTATLAFRDAWF